MSGTQSENRAPFSQIDDTSTARSTGNLVKLKMPYLTTSEKPGLQWPNTKKHIKSLFRCSIPILFAICSIVGLLLLMVPIIHLTQKYDGDSPQSKLVESMEEMTEEYNFLLESGVEFKRDGSDELFDAMISDKIEEPDQSLTRVRRIRKRQAPTMFGSRSDDGLLSRTPKLHRVQTGSKFPRETERDSYTDETLNLGKRSIQEREKNRICKRSMEQCKTVLKSMKPLRKTVGNNVERLNELMDEIQIYEEMENTNPQTFQTFLQCIECKKMTNDDSIKFLDDSEQDETANYNHPVFQNRQSQMENALTTAETLNNPKPLSSDVKKRMIGQMEGIVDMNEFPTSWMDENVYNPNIKKTVDIAKTKNKTDDMEITYIIQNTTIIKHLPKKGSRGELSQPKSIGIEVPTARSLVFNTPKPEKKWGWGEVTGAQTIGEESATPTTIPDRIKSDQGANQEFPSENLQTGARIATGPHRKQTKNIYDGNSVLFPTAETMKTSQQVQFTPPVPWSPYSVCFFGSPNSGSPTGPRQPMTFPASSPARVPFSTNPFFQRGFSYAGPPINQGFSPMQYQQQYPYGNQVVGFQQIPHMGPTALGGQGFFPNFGSVPTAPGPGSGTPYYCKYMPSPAYQFPSQPEVAGFQREQDYPSSIVSGRAQVINSDWNSEIPNHLEFTKSCTADQRRCRDGSYCIPKESWCNTIIDCPDASDESGCSCRSRVDKERICDGYFDCPRGEDELGCFGCSILSFSCKDWSRSDGLDEECVPLSQRCDGLEQCSNGKDEEGCSILKPTFFENDNLNAIGYTVGYLHRNWQGQWFPSCTPTKSWATDACIAENSFFPSKPLRMEFKSILAGEYSGPYVALSQDGEIKIVETCNETAVYVECPPIICGTRVLPHQKWQSPIGRSEDSFVGMTKNATDTTNNVIDQILGSLSHAQTTETTDTNTSQIVGAEWRVIGGEASQPKGWPFLVAIHKDGFFICGGTIIYKKWILTAAHCVERFEEHYYEVRAGLLRRLSFAASVQTRRADSIRIHPFYNRAMMKNDLALIKLDEPLLFNRWVRVACLPMRWPSGNSKNEPSFDKTCVTAGWGSLSEHGPGPDHLREVEVPIARQCKHVEDQNDVEICAGLPEGGSDACQGDSGGPLMCNFPQSKAQWYVAGIVSHGEGCGRPNEPGAYTKVGHFMDWIDGIVIADDREPAINSPKPLAKCPGFTCKGGLGRCLPNRKRCDGKADCLNAEDERNCPLGLFTRRKQSSPKHHTDFSDSKIVGQANPTVGDEIIFTVEAPNVLDNEIPENPNSTEPPMVEIKKTPTMTSAVADSSEANSTTDSSGSEQPKTTTINLPRFPVHDVKERYFICTRMLQRLTVDKRCNRIIDCEDGTDEDNCTCKDYLANLYPKAICNGHVDCDDGSDEENCAFCRDDEFTCSRSGTCIPKSKWCDRKVDCHNMEDELDCFALTMNGDQIMIDADGRPQFNLDGVVTKWENQTWRPLCVNQQEIQLSELSNQFCKYFGLGSAEHSQKVPVLDSALTVKEPTNDLVYQDEYPMSFKTPDENINTCDGLYIQCKPFVTAKASRYAISNPFNSDVDYIWPWQASVFTDGHYRCPGTLLDRSWLLVASPCIENLDLERNYTMAVAGTAPTYLHVNGPHQQISRIDSIKPIKNLDAALLHLVNPVHYTRNVQPIFVHKRIFPPTDKDRCVAIGVDDKYRTKTTFLQPVPEPCPPCYRCYRNGTIEDCENETSSNWSGTIVCRGSSSWYPAATFHQKDILCGFQSTQTVASIDYGNALLTEIMEGDLETIAAPQCTGFRCPFGKCISLDKVLNGVDDCRDRSDEYDDNRLRKKDECETIGGPHCKCSKSELTCANGQCVPKEAFCDSHFDCEDHSDETANCTCADYLRLTAPDRLCDNVRDCLDKSDENSQTCKCEEDRFKCSGSVNAAETCISRDFVCDGEEDCPNGEDEKVCQGIQGSPTDPHGTGQRLLRSFGVRHTECSPFPATSIEDMSNLGKKMNNNKVENPDIVHGKATVPIRDEFHMIRVNSRTWITTRRNRPLVTPEVASRPCH